MPLDQDSKRFYISDLLSSAIQFDQIAASSLAYRGGDGIGYWGYWEIGKRATESRVLMVAMERELKERPGRG